VTQIAFGKKLHHAFLPNGKGTARTEALSSPDDITQPAVSELRGKAQQNGSFRTSVRFPGCVP
jgi:hypothetical protein